MRLGLTSHPEVTKCWNKTLPHVQSMQRHVNGLANKVNSNRAQKGSMTSGQTFTLLQEFAQPGVDTLKLIAGGMLDGLHALLQQISKYGNAKITIPVLSGLYKTIVGHDLTVFDAVSLILGFVTNAITSIVTGQAPPVIPDLQSSTTLGRLVGVYTPRLPAKAITDFHTLTGGLVVTCTILYRIVEYFKLLKQIATGGVKVSSGIGITDCLWAIFQGVYTIHSFPTDPDMPGMVFRGQVNRIPSLNATTRGQVADPFSDLRFQYCQERDSYPRSMHVRRVKQGRKRRGRGRSGPRGRYFCCHCRYCSQCNYVWPRYPGRRV
jgi:hypothetical protein